MVSGAARPVRASSRDRVPGARLDPGQRRRLGVPGRGQPRAGHPPRLAHRAVAAGHPHRPQGAGAGEALEVAGQQLAAPHRPVGAVPGAVVDGPDGGAALAVLGEDGRQVGVVVLDGDVLDALAGQRVGGRQVVGVQVVGDDLRRHGEELLEVRDALGEGAQRLLVAQVADVVADPGARALGHAERALELGPAGQQPGGGERERERRGDVAARAAQHERPAADGAHDRVVGARVDRAVVEQDVVGDAGQALARVVVAVGDRLVGHVAARHHERRRGVVREQVVQRRVGQHHAELAAARGDRRRHGRAGAPRGEHDRPLVAGQQRRLGLPQLDQRPRRRDVARHERERPVLAVLARAQPRDRAARRRRGTRGGSRPGP